MKAIAAFSVIITLSAAAAAAWYTQNSSSIRIPSRNAQILPSILQFFNIGNVIPSISPESRFGLCLFDSGQNCINPIFALSCVISLTLSNFSLFELERYNEFFDSSSALSFAEIGTYIGVDEIREYAAFINSQYLSSYTFKSDSYFIQFIGSRWNTCQVIFIVDTVGELNPAVTGNEYCFETPVGTKLTYTSGFFFGLFGSGFRINRLDLFYPEKFMTDLFGTALNTDEVGSYVCGVMENSCSGTFVANNLTTPESCLTKFNSLDATGLNGYIDGNTKGCRMLHATFAELNDVHCAHISFVPALDPLGRSKCQSGEGLELSDLFTAQQLDYITSSGVEFGYDAETLFANCTNVSSMNIFS